MRWLQLYIRSRRLPAATAVLVLSTLALWALNTVSRSAIAPFYLGMATALGVSAAAVTLAGADLDLDRTAAIAWLPRRTLHLTSTSAVLALVLLLTRVSDNALGSTETILRGVLGMAGLAALGATLFGAPLGWLLPTAALVTTIALYDPSHPGNTLQQILTWSFQPDGSSPAMITAIVLGVGGTLTYSASGCRR